MSRPPARSVGRAARGVTALVALVAVVALAGCKNPLASAADAGPVVLLDAALPPLVVLDAAPPDDIPVEDAGVPAPTPKPLTTATPAAAPPPFASGESWNGAYNCGESRTLKLQITSVAGATVNAIFDFRTRAGKSGAFHVSGRYDRVTRHLHLNPGAWVVQPPGIVPVELDGIVGPEGHTYAGAVIGAHCTSFSVRR